MLPNLGGQTGLNLTAELHKNGILDKYGVKVIGVQADAIERGEDRIAFKDDDEQARRRDAAQRADVQRRGGRERSRRNSATRSSSDPPTPWAAPAAASLTTWKSFGPSSRAALPPASSARCWSRSRSSDGRNSSWRSCATPRTR